MGRVSGQQISPGYLAVLPDIQPVSGQKADPAHPYLLKILF